MNFIQFKEILELNSVEPKQPELVSREISDEELSELLADEELEFTEPELTTPELAQEPMVSSEPEHTEQQDINLTDSPETTPIESGDVDLESNSSAVEPPSEVPTSSDTPME